METRTGCCSEPGEQEPLAQWLEALLPTKVVWVQLPPSMSYLCELVIESYFPFLSESINTSEFKFKVYFQNSSSKLQSVS